MSDVARRYLPLLPGRKADGKHVRDTILTVPRAYLARPSPGHVAESSRYASVPKPSKLRVRAASENRTTFLRNMLQNGKV